MIVIGMMGDKVIKYIFAKSALGANEILHKYYRCPKKVDTLIRLGDVRNLEVNIQDIQGRGEFFKSYHNGSEKFLYNNSYNTYLFENGTWYVKLLVDKKFILLSELFLARLAQME